MIKCQSQWKGEPCINTAEHTVEGFNVCTFHLYRPLPKAVPKPKLKPKFKPKPSCVVCLDIITGQVQRLECPCSATYCTSCITRLDKCAQCRWAPDMEFRNYCEVCRGITSPDEDYCDSCLAELTCEVCGAIGCRDCDGF